MNVFWSVTKYFLLGSNVASHTKRSRTKKHCLCRGAVASWLARSPPHRVARVRALTGEKPCCVNLSLTVPLSYEFSKVWLPCSIPSRESRITPNRFVLLTPEISGSLMATWFVYADVHFFHKTTDSYNDQLVLTTLISHQILRTNKTRCIDGKSIFWEYDSAAGVDHSPNRRITPQKRQCRELGLIHYSAATRKSINSHE